jgi:ribosomal protein L21E
LLTKLIQQQLLQAQQRMKALADANTSEREFQLGDIVYLKLHPHMQSSVASRSNQKLAFKYYGPVKVL